MGIAIPHIWGNVGYGELKRTRVIPYALPASCCGAQCNRLRVRLGRAVMSDGGKAVNPPKIYTDASLRRWELKESSYTR